MRTRMHLPLQITFHEIDHSPAAEHHIRAQAEKLQHFDASLLSCRVTLEQEHRHSPGGAPRVRLSLVVPGDELVVDYTPPPDHGEEGFHAAIDQAFAKAKSRLVRHAGRVRDELVRRGRGVPASR